VEVASVVDANLSLLAVDEEEATEEEIAVAVLVAEAIVGVVDAEDAALELDAEVVVDASGVLEAVAEVSLREEVVDAAEVSAAGA
jgi:hypothetical protein